MNKYLFVYGTIRKHEANHFYMENSKLISEQAWTKGRIYEGPSYYPVLLDEDDTVYGELYEVNSEILKEVDMLEGFTENGHDNLYERSIRNIYTDHGTYEGYVYYLSPENKEMAVHSIEQGDWRVHQLLKKDQVIYFAFGSCMDDERFKLAGVETLFHEKLGRGELEGYKLIFSHHVEDGGRADIVEADDTVEGILYKTPLDAVDYLFQREGVYSGHYRPTVVDVKLGDQCLNNVMTFYVLDKKEDLSPPFHYAREIHRGAAPYLSESYMGRLEKKFLEKFNVNGFKEYIQGTNRNKKQQ
ncbi:gamma-glutamylcyclotransferase family protein [Thalassobacillus pellis]|uniref:gamma-glutamylcyclotransferase family protein n=1 Tax=Thalassobacillus pellis TaxID=748008 RepID=UPI001961C602|nr:gamma-glutamylcyclotransferase family protein [Thalassobacillus pellis]MBM7552555.1 gamma-glutamylcyclotransferase (GGCT)/AIG2-like uncharacterized protein YtfP [Thalassobacillus pellis]